MGNIFTIDFGKKRVYGLDILRALAILIVIFAHSGTLLPKRFTGFLENFFVDGVFLFFVLSGFLIGGILIKVLESKGTSIKSLFGFWIRRWFRTIPNYFLILTLLIIIGFTLNGGLGGTNPLQYFLFLQNFNYPHPQFFSEAWTLSVEEWFYITIPILIFILVGIFKIPPQRAIVTTVIAIVAASIALRLYRYSMHAPVSIGEWDAYYRKEVVTRMDSLMFGVLGAYLAYYHKALWVRHKHALFWIGLGIIVATHVVLLYIAQGTNITERGYGLYLSVFSFSITAAGILFLLPFLSEHKTGKGPVYTALTSISIASYSMYLIHVSLIQPFVFGLIAQGTTAHSLMIIRYGLYWLLTIGASILLYKYFEKPTTNLREKIANKRASKESSDVVTADERSGQVVAGVNDIAQ